MATKDAARSASRWDLCSPASTLDSNLSRCIHLPSFIFSATLLFLRMLLLLLLPLARVLAHGMADGSRWASLRAMTTGIVARG